MKLEQESKGVLEKLKIVDEREAETVRKRLYEIQAENKSI